MTEPAPVTGALGTTPPVPTTSPAEAAARLDALINNKEWGQRYLEGGAAERKQFSELTSAIANGSAVQDAIEGKAPPPSMTTTTTDGELPPGVLIRAAADLGARGLTDQAIADILGGQQKFSIEEITAAERWRDRLMGDQVRRAALFKGDSDLARQLTVACAVIACGAGAP
jgi:hypothetical protein